MNLLLDFHDFLIVFFRLKGSSCVRSVSLSQASWIRVAKYHFAVTQYSLIPTSPSRWPMQTPVFVCPAVVKLWYMIRTQAYQHTQWPKDMLLEPDITLTGNRCPLREENTLQGKKIQWNGKKTLREREKSVLWFMCEHVFILPASCWFGKHVIQSRRSCCWYEWLKFCPRLWQLKSGRWIQAVLEMTHSRNDILRLPAGIWSALCWQLPVCCFELPHFPSVKLFHVLSVTTDKHFDLLLRLYRFYSNALTKVYGGECSGGFRVLSNL